MRVPRVKPFRGAQVAAGAVVLTVLVALLHARFADEWAPGTHLAYTAAAAALVAWLGLGSPMEPRSPRPYQTALYVSAFALLLGVLVDLANVLGADGSGAGTITWTAAALTAFAAYLAAGRRSPTGTLLAGVSAIVTAIAFAVWAADPTLQAIRWILLAVIVAGTLLVIEHRDRRPAHAVQLVNVVGLALLAIGLSAIVATFLHSFAELLAGRGDARAGLGWGWELLLLAGGCGLLAYGGVEYVRGPAVLGVAVLATFAALAGAGDLVGWPMVLAAIAGVMLVIGLRPSTPLPPPPDEPGAEADVTTLRPPEPPLPGV
jgi:hypothetical protein